MRKLTLFLTALVLGLASTGPAAAYIGPGAGISAIGTVLAVLGAGILLVVGFIWYPVKRLMRSRKAAASASRNDSSDPKT